MNFYKILLQDFENYETVNLSADLYTGDHFHSIPKGSLKGISNGLKLLLDVESFEYSFYFHGALGLRILLSDPRDQALIFQDSSNVLPGPFSV